MRWMIVCALGSILVATAQAEELRFQVVDAVSGKPIDGVTVKRWASKWQPRVLSLPGKFWFPDAGKKTDARGQLTIDKVAWDDWYKFEIDGYEAAKVKRVFLGKFEFTASAEEKARALMKQDGVLIVTMKRRLAKEDKDW